MTTPAKKHRLHAISAALREAAVAEYKMRAICRAAVERLGNIAPFSDVRVAASHRARALAALAIRLGVSVPRDPFAPFRVGIPAPASRSHACRAAATVTRRHIAIYERLLGEDLPPEVADVLTRLLDGTRDHHLPAFERGARTDAPLEASLWAL